MNEELKLFQEIIEQHFDNKCCDCEFFLYSTEISVCINEQPNIDNCKVIKRELK